MLKIENFEVMGWEHAIRGMRNPMNSWAKSDSEMELPFIHVGPNDHQLMMSLAKGGPVHAKYRRMLTVYLDITAPLYWWKEFDTYKVGTVANSCSTMHKIHAKPFSREDFSCDRLDEGGLAMLDAIISYLEAERSRFLANKEDRRSWHNMIQILPTSYNQMRTVSLNYENLINIYYARKTHKLAEWHELCRVIENLPFAKELILIKGDEE